MDTINHPKTASFFSGGRERKSLRLGAGLTACRYIQKIRFIPTCSRRELDAVLLTGPTPLIYRWFVELRTEKAGTATFARLNRLLFKRKNLDQRPSLSRVRGRRAGSRGIGTLQFQRSRP